MRLLFLTVALSFSLVTNSQDFKFKSETIEFSQWNKTTEHFETIEKGEMTTLINLSLSSQEATFDCISCKDQNNLKMNLTKKMEVNEQEDGVVILSFEGTDASNKDKIFLKIIMSSGSPRMLSVRVDDVLIHYGKVSLL